MIDATKSREVVTEGSHQPARYYNRALLSLKNGRCIPHSLNLVKE